MQLVAEEARAGKLFGVWNTDDANGLRLIHRHGRSWLEGRKILASGAGHIERPLVTATDENGRRMIVLPNWARPIAPMSRVGRRTACAPPRPAPSISPALKSSPWRSWAERATTNANLGFPWARGALPQCIWAAWRGYSIFFGGICGDRSGQDPHQAARLGRAAMAVETARLWVAQAASTAEASLGARAPEQLVAYVNLARLAVEAAALELMQLAQRSVGLQAFMRPIRSSAYRGPCDLSAAAWPGRALTDAAAWVLAQPVDAQDLWR